MKQTILFLTILLVFTSCAEEEGPNVPALKNLDDVQYEVGQHGDLNLKKSYSFPDDSSLTTSQTASKSRQHKRGYEVVPSFEKSYNSNLSLKNRNKHKKIVLQGEEVKVSVESIPLNEFVDLIFGNVLKLNYTVSEKVKKLTTPITLNMTNLQPKQEVYDVVKKLLSLNGVTIKKSKGVLFLSKKNKKDKESITSGLYIGYGKKVSKNIPDDTTILMFVPYNYVSGKHISKVLKNVGITNIKYSYMLHDMQMMKGSAGDIRQALKVIELVDKPFLKNKVPYLVEFENIEASKFIERMKDVFATNAVPIARDPTSPGILMKPIPEVNGMLVISSKRSWMDMIMYWKKKLDIETEIGHDIGFYTYKVRNRKADELAEVLNSVIDLKLSSTDTLTEIPNESNSQKTIEVSTHTVKADLPTNTLMMQLLPSEYKKVLPLIRRLDALPLQVLTEITLAEVTLTDSFSLGFEYAIRNSDASIGILDLNKLATAFGGSGFVATFNSKALDVTVNALAQKKLLSILSKPKILILNNTTGTMNVGKQVPIITSESSAEDLDSSILRNVSYKDTGVQVGLTPTINSNGILTMNINLQISAAQLNDTSDIDSPLIVNRSVSTSLILKHGETVLLGGLIDTIKSTSDSGVPILMDIPGLGNIFKSQSESVVKTELIMLIKPSIIVTPEQLSRETYKYRALLKLLNQYSVY